MNRTGVPGLLIAPPVGAQPRPRQSPRATMHPSLQGMHLAALGGKWEDWCDQGGADSKYAGNMQVCKWGGGALVNPYAEPWTDVGVAERWTAAAVANAVHLPSPDDFAPVKLFGYAYSDPIYAGLLTAVATVVVPAVGAVLVGSYATPILNLVHLPEVIGLALIFYNGWAGVEQYIIGPMIDWGGSAADAVVSFLTGGAAGGAAAVMRQVARRLRKDAKAPPASAAAPNPVLMETAAILEAIANYAFTIIDDIRHPELFKTPSTWADIGTKLKLAAKSIPPGPVADFFVTMGDGLTTFQWTFAALADKRVTQTSDDPGQAGALDNLTVGMLGVTFSKFVKDVQAGVDSAKRAASSITPAHASLADALGQVADKISAALKKVNAGGTFNGIIDALTAFAQGAGDFIQHLHAANVSAGGPGVVSTGSPSGGGSGTSAKTGITRSGQVKRATAGTVEAEVLGAAVLATGGLAVLIWRALKNRRRGRLSGMARRKRRRSR